MKKNRIRLLNKIKYISLILLILFFLIIIILKCLRETSSLPNSEMGYIIRNGNYSLLSFKNEYGNSNVMCLKEKNDFENLEDNTQLIGTGCKTTINNITYYFAINSDLSGDGIAQMNDVNYAYKQVIGNTNFDNTTVYAADYNNDGKILINDINAMYKRAINMDVNDYQTVENILFESNLTSSKVDQIVNLHAKIVPADAKNKTIIYRTENENICQVDKDGNIKIISYGECKVSAHVDGRIVTKTLTVENNDSISIYSDDILTFQTKEEYGSKNIYPVFDFTSQVSIIDDNGLTPYSDKNLDNTMRTLKNMGFTRIYVVTHNQGIPSLGNTLTLIKPIPDVKGHIYYEKYYEQVHGDFDTQFIKYVHKYGMEAIAIYKPYEGGGGTSFPLDATVSNTAYANFITQKTILTGATGKRTYFTDFIANNPTLRVKRKYDSTEIENSKLPINKVEMYFYRSAQDSTAAGGEPILWVSDKNGEYEVYEDITYSYERVNNYIVKDVNGFAVSNSPIIAYKLTININNLPQKYRYVAVSFDENSATMKYRFITYPFSMIKIYNGTTEIPSSISHYARRAFNPAEGYSAHTWGYENTPINLTYLDGVNYNNGKISVINNSNYDYVTEAKYFNVWGFEFNYRSTGVGTTIGLRSPIFAIAAGKEEYIPGEICESEEKVKKHMVNEALALYNKGYDGVEVRYTSHSSVVTDYVNYGYNDSIRNRYYNLYNKYPENEAKDDATQKKVAVRISEIRGDNFVDFMERLKKAKPNNKKLMIEIYATGYEEYLKNPNTYTPNDGANQIFNPSFAHIIFTNNKLDRLVSIVDEITFRDNLSHKEKNPEDNGKATNSVGSEIISMAQKYSKKLNIVCFLSQGNNKCPPVFFENIKNNSFDGVQFYELTEWRLSETGTHNFKSVINTVGDSTFNYNFSDGTTLQVNGNITVETLIKNLNSIGTMHVLDNNNKMVAKTSKVINDMQLVIISGENKYVFQIKVI